MKNKLKAMVIVNGFKLTFFLNILSIHVHLYLKNALKKKVLKFKTKDSTSKNITKNYVIPDFSIYMNHWVLIQKKKYYRKK